MLIRSRSARFAALALAVTTPLVAATALPAFAAGEYTTAVLTSPEVSGTTFTWDYTFHQGEQGAGLSNIAIGFCSAELLADVVSYGPSAEKFTDEVPGGHAGFGPGIKFALTAPTGTLTVTFGHVHAVTEDALQVQSHSGDGQDPDLTETADGPGCAPTENGGGDNNGGGGGDNNNGGGGDNNNGGGGDNNNGGGGDTTVQPTDIVDDHGPVKKAETPSSHPAPTTSEVLGVTITDGSNPAPAAAPAASPAVSGNNAVAPAAELPHTGAGNIQFLMALALSLLAAGVALRAAFGRRIRSASSPS